jgi:hypothetical protein
MTRGRTVAWGVLLLAVAGAVAAAYILLPRWYMEPAEPSNSIESAAAPTTPKIKARLFYLSEDGLRLVAVEREIPFGEGTLLQARRIVEAQLERPAAPFVTVIPEGTRLRAIFVGTNGEAFVDLSREASTAHPGGALEEILTVYSIVNAVTTNLPVVRAVQILVDGHEVDTLAGHVDLRRPLPRGASWIQEPTAPVQPASLDPVPAPPIPAGLTPPRDVPPIK